MLRALYESDRQQQIRVVAINDLAPFDAMAHLTRFDSTHGRFAFPVELEGSTLKVAQDSIQLFNQADPVVLPWRELGVDLVLDCTGIYGSRADGELHLAAGASKVLFSHPGASDLDATIVYGVNHQSLTGDEKLVSNASCTTNCVIPAIEALHQAFGIERGSITTIHSAMHDQQVIDSYHPDLRRTRAAGVSVIPVNTGLAKGIERILPHFEGKFEATAVRVPTVNVTAMDLTVCLKQAVTQTQVNHLLQQQAQGPLRGILDYVDQPLVSVDYNHDSHSCIVDATQTRVSDGRLLKLLLWCDNEWGFANRMLDTTLALMRPNN